MEEFDGRRKGGADYVGMMRPSQQDVIGEGIGHERFGNSGSVLTNSRGLSSARL